MTDFLFSLLTEDYPLLSKFNNQKELNDYFGFEVPLNFDKMNQEDLNSFIDTWVTDNNFEIMEERIVECDLDAGYIITEVIYRLGDKYYIIEYTRGWSTYDELSSGPDEVERVVTNQPLIKYIRK